MFIDICVQIVRLEKQTSRDTLICYAQRVGQMGSMRYALNTGTDCIQI